MDGISSLTSFMTQDEKWTVRYNEVVTFIETNKRNPSRYIPEERGKYCNWLKHQRKQYNSGEMKGERRAQFEKLLEMMGHYKRKNQYE